MPEKSGLPGYRDPTSLSGYKEGVSDSWVDQDRRHRRRPRLDGERRLRSLGLAADPTLAAPLGNQEKPTAEESRRDPATGGVIVEGQNLEPKEASFRFRPGE